MRILLFILITTIAIANCYKYWGCSSLIPWHVPGNDTIMCKNLQDYCTCMDFFYSDGKSNKKDVCISACHSIGCNRLINNLDCNSFYKYKS